MDVNEHERLTNITCGHTLKVHLSFFLFLLLLFYFHSRRKIFNKNIIKTYTAKPVLSGHI